MRLVFIFICLLFIRTNTVHAISDTIPKKSLPAGAVPFYNFKNNVVLEGIINDSIPIKALLDIGTWGIAIPERFGIEKETTGTALKDEIRFKVGNWERKQVATVMTDNSQFLRWYGEECVLLGWDFFDDKILEISYKNHYIKTLERAELDSLNGYDCIGFSNRGKRLIVPASVKTQGKLIKGDFWIDTGLNGTLFFTYNIPTDYELDLNKTNVGRAKNLDTNQTKIIVLKTDTIQIGNSFLIDRDIIVSDSEWFVFKKNGLYIGLIGNQFFSNFSVIFDFQQNKLYIKQ